MLGTPRGLRVFSAEIPTNKDPQVRKPKTLFDPIAKSGHREHRPMSGAPQVEIGKSSRGSPSGGYSGSLAVA